MEFTIEELELIIEALRSSISGLNSSDMGDLIPPLLSLSDSDIDDVVQDMMSVFHNEVYPRHEKRRDATTVLLGKLIQERDRLWTKEKVGVLAFVKNRLGR